MLPVWCSFPSSPFHSDNLGTSQSSTLLWVGHDSGCRCPPLQSTLSAGTFSHHSFSVSLFGSSFLMQPFNIGVLRFWPNYLNFLLAILSLGGLSCSCSEKAVVLQLSLYFQPRFLGRVAENHCRNWFNFQLLLSLSPPFTSASGDSTCMHLHLWNHSHHIQQLYSLQ
jgi:hypothetical protein